MPQPKVGVFICRCGGNISDTVDCDHLREKASKWSYVVVARVEDYLCSKPSQDRLVEAIKSRGLDRVVVACCTPRMHLSTFHDAMRRAGLNPYMLEFVNIREQCSWVHADDKEAATKKALRLLKGGYERCLELEPLEPMEEPCRKEVLVIGGGIAGITCSLELADKGYKVYLVEKGPSIGGNMAKLTKVFPTLDCAQCILTPKMAEVSRHPNITLLTLSEVENIEGYPGNYTVKVKVKPRGVDVSKCAGCGICSKACPVEVDDEYNENRSKRKAIYVPFPQAVPYAYVIDFSACTRCGACIEKCPRDAIRLDEEESQLELKVGGVVVAVGYELLDAKLLEDYGYGQYPDVITMMELERLTSLFGPTKGLLRKFSDQSEVKKIAIVLCAGSRDRNRYVPYCSKVCCMYSLKQAVLLREQFGVEVWIFYTDIRAAGKGYEELYVKAQESGVVFVRGRVAEIRRGEHGLLVRAENTLLGKVMEEEFDLVALATPMIPPSGLRQLADKVSLPIGEDGFIQEKHPKLGPVDLLRAGIYACGCALGPRDVRDSVADALAASSRVDTFLRRGVVISSPEKPWVYWEQCDGCGACMEVCPIAAIELKEGKAAVKVVSCIGCGACIPACPKSAIDFKNYTRRQLEAQLKGLLAEKREGDVVIVAFVEKNIAYTGLDFLGLDRVNYPAETLPIAIPSSAILGRDLLLKAFMLGADGIVVIEGQKWVDEAFRWRFEEALASLEEAGVESTRVYYSLIELPAYRKIADILRTHTSMVRDLGPLGAEERVRLSRAMEAR